MVEPTPPPSDAEARRGTAEPPAGTAEPPAGTAEPPAPAGHVDGSDATLDLRSLAEFFSRHVPGFDGTLRASLLQGGRSNLTYLVSDGVRRWVLRRPPLGPVAPTANDIGREYRVMRALRSTPVPVPDAIAFCEDPSLVGAPFSVVSMVDGRVVRTEADGASLAPEDAARLAGALVRGLAAIHSVPYREVGLDRLGRPTGYLRRQVDRWWRQWELVATRPLAALGRLHERLEALVPADRATTLVHGDYRLDNTIVDPTDAGKLAAVVDWEMATLGDPLADLGLMLVYWDPTCAPVLPDGHAVGANPGFPSVDELASAYERESGRAIDGLDFYRALGYFKLAVIAEGIHGRFVAGATVGEGFETVGRAVAPLVDAGLAVLGEPSGQPGSGTGADPPDR